MVPRTLQRLVHALLSNRKHPVHHIGSGRYFIWSGGSLCPPNVLTGPLFLNRGDPGTPQGKILVRTQSLRQPWRWCTWRDHALIITKCCWKFRCHKLWKLRRLKSEPVLAWCLTTHMYKAVCHSSGLAFGNLSQNLLHWTVCKINSFNMNVTVWTFIAGCLFVSQCLFLYLPKKKLPQAFRIFIISWHQF